MKFVKLFGVAVIALAAVLILTKSIKFREPSPILGTETDTVSGGDSIDLHETKISQGEHEYSVVFSEVDASHITLNPNFESKETASTFFTENGCKLLVNGGFYSAEQENKSVYNPIGLFIADGDKISGFRENKLFNGIFSVNDFLTPRITRQVPQDHINIGLQTGPILIENASALEIKNVSDDHSRRSVAAVTGGNKVVFMSFYLPGHAFSGPTLSELPGLVQKVSNDNNLNIADAVNLDGGSASAYYAKNVNLSEASPVGSFFCIR